MLYDAGGPRWSYEWRAGLLTFVWKKKRKKELENALRLGYMLPSKRVANAGKAGSLGERCTKACSGEAHPQASRESPVCGGHCT
eukprot:5776377-Prymnesium_polylepis.1